MLRAVRRRLRRQHVASAARSAAWLTVVAAIIALLLHAFVRPVHAGGVALVVAFTWLLAVVQAILRPIDSRSCAAWADRQLDGTSAYGTYLELRDSVEVDRPAWRRLVEWLEQSAPRSIERLAATPQDLQLQRPLAIALVTVTLAAALLQLPMQTDPLSARASPAAQQPDAAQSERTVAEARVGRDHDADTRADAALARARGAADGASSSRRGSGAASVEASDDTLTPPDESRGAPATTAAERAAAGGRDAGSTADTADDPGLSAAWQGEIAAQFRELSASSHEPSRADPTLTADYRDVLAADDASGTNVNIEPAAAVAPEARDHTPLGPAEQAYVRAYFADSGALP